MNKVGNGRNILVSFSGNCVYFSTTPVKLDKC